MSRSHIINPKSGKYRQLKKDTLTKELGERFPKKQVN